MTTHPSSVRRRLIAAREALGFTRQELASASGLSYAAVLSIENGRSRRLHARTISKLSSALEIDPDWLLRGVGGEQRPAGPKPKQQRFVYFARRRTDGAIKIGSSSDPVCRCRQLSRRNQRVELIGMAAGSFQEELALHSRFRKQRIDGEWFRSAPELEIFIAEAISRNPIRWVPWFVVPYSEAA